MARFAKVQLAPRAVIASGLNQFLVVALIGLVLASCSMTPTRPTGTTWQVLPGHVETLIIPAFRNGRACQVYLPPGYYWDNQRYPVLYLNDGETAFDSDVGLHVNRIADAEIRRGRVLPVIIVAISSGGGHQRYVDYTPWTSSEYAPNGGGDGYLSAIVDTLKPEIDARYRTLNDRQHTAIAGTSLGGLIAIYAGYKYPNVFGMIACFSPYYDYARGAMYELVRSASAPNRPLRIYQATGDTNDNSVTYMHNLLLTTGYVSNGDLSSLTLRGATHDPASWQREFGPAIEFLFTVRHEP